MSEQDLANILRNNPDIRALVNGRIDQPVAGATVDCGPERRPERRRSGPSEHDEQVRLFRMFDEHAVRRPELALAFAIPNGGYRSKATAGKLKAEGVKAGAPDICVPVARGGSHGLFVELKRPGGRVSPAQAQWLKNLTAQGYAAVVCYGADSAFDEILSYLDG